MGRVILVEQRVSIPFYANEIIHFMDGLHIDQAIICGYSAGCLIAQQLGLFKSWNVFNSMILTRCLSQSRYSLLVQSLHKMGMYMVKQHKNMLIQTIARSHSKEQVIKDMLTQTYGKGKYSSLVSLLFGFFSVSL